MANRSSLDSRRSISRDKVGITETSWDLRTESLKKVFQALEITEEILPLSTDDGYKQYDTLPSSIRLLDPSFGWRTSWTSRGWCVKLLELEFMVGLWKVLDLAECPGERRKIQPTHDLFSFGNGSLWWSLRLGMPQKRLSHINQTPFSKSFVHFYIMSIWKVLLKTQDQFTTTLLVLLKGHSSDTLYNLYRGVVPEKVYLHSKNTTRECHCYSDDRQVHSYEVQTPHLYIFSAENVPPDNSSQRCAESHTKCAIIDTYCHAINGSPEASIANPVFGLDILPCQNDLW